jgi:hypothetical protein
MGRPGSEAIGMVDVGSASEDRCDQREDLAARSRATDPIEEANFAVHECLEAEAHHQRRGHDKPGIGHQSRIVKGHPDPVDPARY